MYLCLSLTKALMQLDRHPSKNTHYETRGLKRQDRHVQAISCPDSLGGSSIETQFFDIDWLNQSISCFTCVWVAFASCILIVAHTACISKFPNSDRTIGSSTASSTRRDNRNLQRSKSLCRGMMFRLNTSTFSTVPSVYPISRTSVAHTFGKTLPQVSLRVKDTTKFSSDLLIAAVACLHCRQVT